MPCQSQTQRLVDVRAMFKPFRCLLYIPDSEILRTAFSGSRVPETLGRFPVYGSYQATSYSGAANVFVRGPESDAPSKPIAHSRYGAKHGK